ncbi:MAG: 50S ribosomal protein L21 [candidate division WS1 bacterium]|nr:50S ribosomal protein L21 [candidate division WS1 bacterium]
MYAIIEHGGHQYRAEEQGTLRLPKMAAEPGAKVVFDKVLALSAENFAVGTPHLAGAEVRGTVLEQGRGPKIRIFKYKRKKHYKRQSGHRQEYTAVRVDQIVAGAPVAKG